MHLSSGSDCIYNLNTGSESVEGVLCVHINTLSDIEEHKLAAAMSAVTGLSTDRIVLDDPIPNSPNGFLVCRSTQLNTGQRLHSS